MYDSYKYDDFVSDSIFNFYNSCEDKCLLKKFIDLYISDVAFFDFVHKNFLIDRLDTSYLLHLFEDYDSDNIVDEYDYITSVNTTRWI